MSKGVHFQERAIGIILTRVAAVETFRLNSYLNVISGSPEPFIMTTVMNTNNSSLFPIPVYANYVKSPFRIDFRTSKPSHKGKLTIYDMEYFVGVIYLYNFLENFLVVDPNLLVCRMNND